MKSGLYVLLSAAKEMTNIPEAHSHRSVMICKDLLAERYLKLIVSLPSPPQTTVSLCPQFKGSISILVSGTVHTAAGSIAVGCHDTMLSRYRCRDQRKCAFLPAVKPRRSMHHSDTIRGMEEVEVEYFLVIFCE